MKMKSKLTLLALACGLSFASQAQTSEDETLKPNAGNKTLEATIHPYSSNSGEIRFRKFSSQNFAYRYAVRGSYDYDKHADDASSSRYISISLIPGIEKHFTGTRRLSPYIGATLPIGVTSGHYEDEGIEVKGSTSPDGYYNRSSVNIGLNGLAGADFYVAKNFYIGIEAGIGATYYRSGKVERTAKESTSPLTDIEGKHSISLDTYTSSGIRVGFVF